MIGEMDSQQKQRTSEFDYGREVERAILHVFVVRREHPMDHPVWRRRVASRPRDIFYLTQETQFSVHRSTSSLPRSWSLRQRLLGNERRQPQQVFDAEVRATGRRPHEPIRRRQARIHAVGRYRSSSPSSRKRTRSSPQARYWSMSWSSRP